MSKDTLSIDYETYSDADLSGVGVSRYCKHPSTEILMAAYSLNGADERQWIPAQGQDMPRELEEALFDPEVEKWAWNAPFEIAITSALIRPVDTRQWRCSMVVGLTCSLPGSLDAASKALNLKDDSRKDAAGSRLMRKFSFPRKPTARDPRTRVLWHDDLEDWNAYLAYNRQDVRAERAVLRKLWKFRPPEHEWELWALDQKINQAGLPINLRMVANAIQVYEDSVEAAVKEMQELTGLDNPMSVSQLVPWLRENGYPFRDAKKGHIKRAKERAHEAIEASGNDFAPTEEFKAYVRVLELRQEVSRTSIKKYHALMRATDDDGNLRNVLQFAAAGRTWRWGGRLFQPQNLPRPEKHLEKRIEVHARNVEFLDAESLRSLYGNVFDVLASCIRPAAQAPEGYVFLDADLSAIENIVLGWLAQCEKILMVFERGLDPYLAFAVYLFNMNYRDLSAEYKAGMTGRRTISKPGVLGCLKGDTPVLTHRGWKALVELRADDWLHDGQKWVRHQGVIWKGYQPTLCRAGIHATPDHRFLIGSEWVEWQQASLPQMFSSALATGSGVFSNKEVLPEARANSSCVDAGVGSSVSFHGRTSSEGYPLVAPDALRLTVAPRSASESAETFSTYSQIVSTLRDRVARTLKTVPISGMADGGFLSTSLTPASGFDTSSTNLGPMEVSKWIELTMTETTASETFDSLRDPNRTQICDTWDILNTGDFARFAVLTENGCLVAHNCGYMMGPGSRRFNDETGEWEAGGLLGYAWNMGVKQFTEEDAKLSVETFRREFTEVVDYWYGIERAAKKCIRTGEPVEFGHVTFDYYYPFMRIRLPSGRFLHYLKPKIEIVDTPWGDKKEQITYEGQDDRKQWRRITTHPGKLTENVDQAVARDILASGLLEADRRGIDIRLHVHDQILGLAPEDQAEEALAILNESMKNPPVWAKGMPLKTAGFTSKVFCKD